VKKLLITGGDGFIAKHCKEYFKDKYIIHVPNKSELDLLNLWKLKSYLKTFEFDYVIHAATYDAEPIFSGKDKNKVFLNNTQMFLNLAQCQSDFKRMIYFGSGAENGCEGYSCDNDMPEFPATTQYGYSKHVMSKYITMSTNNIYNLRLFNVFGEYADWRYRILSNLLIKALFDMDMYISENKTTSYIDVDDLVKIIDLMLNKDKLKHKIYNCTSNESYNYIELAEKILQLTKKNLKISTARDNRYKSYTGTNVKLLNEFNDFQFTTLDNTIERLWQYYRKNKYSININKLEY